MNELDFCIKFLDSLLAGDGSVLNNDNANIVNNTALGLYNKPELNEKEVSCLKAILMACNIVYNRTDLELMLVEDGFYDLLLEKYKNYDPNFQVGSAVVNLRNIKTTDINNPMKVAKQPISFVSMPKRNDIRQDIYNDLMRINKPILNANDFHISPISFDNTAITKRMHNTEHNHPDLVGTLDKCKFVLNKDAIDAGCFDDANVKVLERDFFQDHINKGIIHRGQEIEIVCELKYDGISVEADCGLEVLSARTRGDTGIGVAADITPILGGYPFRQGGAMNFDQPLGVKFEAIITKTNMNIFNQRREKSYKNCRSAIVGLFGASDAYLYRDLITLVPLAVDREQVPFIENRLEEIEFINTLFRSHGEPLRYCYFRGTVDQVLYYIKQFLDEAKVCRDYLDFMYDGIVVSYVDENIRAKLGRKNYINKYSMAVKFDPIEKQTRVRGITYEVGQHGQITPMIHYDPVEFIGTIHTKSTGSSLRRFTELDLKYGDIINVTYVNDVMPYVSKLDCDANKMNPNPRFEFVRECPVCGTPLVVSSSGDTTYCPNTECPARNIKRMTNMFSKLNLKGFAESTFESLRDINHFFQLYNYNKDFYISRLGEADGAAFYQILQDIRDSKLTDYMFMGALGFTSLAYKRWQSVFVMYPLKDLLYIYESSNSEFEFSCNLPAEIKGVLRETIAKEFTFFYPDIKFAIENNLLIYSKSGQSDNDRLQIRYSGIRNPQLTELLSSKGFDIDDSGITKKTNILIVPYQGFNSGKVLKAQKNGTVIVPLQEFVDNMDKYIGEKYTL